MASEHESLLGGRMAHQNLGVRRTALRKEQRRQLREQRGDAFDGAVLSPAERLRSARASLLGASRGILFLARAEDRLLSGLLGQLGGFSKKEQGEWRDAFDKGGVRVGVGARTAEVTEVVTPVDSLAGTRDRFMVSAVDPLAKRTATDIGLSTYLPSAVERATAELDTLAARRRRLYVATPSLFRPLVAPLAVLSADVALGLKARRTEMATAANAATAATLGEVFIAGVEATGIDPAKFDPDIQFGLGVNVAVMANNVIGEKNAY